MVANPTATRVVRLQKNERFQFKMPGPEQCSLLRVEPV
jgi:hypothetical protein